MISQKFQEHKYLVLATLLNVKNVILIKLARNKFQD